MICFEKGDSLNRTFLAKVSQTFLVRSNLYSVKKIWAVEMSNVKASGVIDVRKNVCSHRPRRAKCRANWNENNQWKQYNSTVSYHQFFLELNFLPFSLQSKKIRRLNIWNSSNEQAGSSALLRRRRFPEQFCVSPSRHLRWKFGWKVHEWFCGNN